MSDLFRQLKGKSHIAYIRGMARDIMLMRCVSIEDAIKEALQWHREQVDNNERARKKTKA